VNAQVCIGSVCDEWDYGSRRCASQVDVFQMPGMSACHFTTKMSIDADGAPKAYCPGEYYPSNAHHSFDWLNNLNPADQHGVQGQDAQGPAPGFLVSGTALTDTDHFDAKDTRKYVDASAIPYVVLTGRSSFPVPHGTQLNKGCIVFVTDTKTGIYSGAIYADAGRAVGEASLALALMLSINPFSRKLWPKVTGGTSERRIFHLVFPAEIVPAPWSVDIIQSRAADLFNEWGGEGTLRRLFPQMPAMSGPRSVVIEPPKALIVTSRDEDEAVPAFRGQDVPKSKLE